MVTECLDQPKGILPYILTQIIGAVNQFLEPVSRDERASNIS